MTEHDEKMAQYVTEAMAILSANGTVITTADLFETVKHLSGLSRARYRRLEERFKAEQPGILDAIVEHVCHVQAPKNQVRELKRIALVAWLTYKAKQPNLPEVSTEDWEAAFECSYFNDLKDLPHKEVLAVLMTMFTYRLKKTDVMELELGFLLFDLITTIVVALDLAYLRSTFGRSYADQYYQ